jgi:hypothetical protein
MKLPLCTESGKGLDPLEPSKLNSSYNAEPYTHQYQTWFQSIRLAVEPLHPPPQHTSTSGFARFSDFGIEHHTPAL